MTTDPMIARTTSKRRCGFVLLTLVLAWLMIELAALGGALVALRVRGLKYEPIEGASLGDDQRQALERLLAGKDRYYSLSPTLGWTILPGGSDGPYSANLQGFRGDREYDPVAPKGRLRIAVFGDSFVHGDEVSNSETWAAYLEQRAPEREVLNFGVGAYGLGQAYLRYVEDGKAYNPHVVLIGFISGDLARSVTTFFPFYSPGAIFPVAKPRFRLDGEGIVLEPNPLPTTTDYERLLDDPALELPRVGTHDLSYQSLWRRVWFDRLPSVRLVRTLRQNSLSYESERRDGRRVEILRRDGEAFTLTARILTAFVTDVRANGSVPIIIYFPSLRDLRQLRATGVATYSPLVEHLAGKGVKQIDLSTAFLERGDSEMLEDLFVAPQHWHYVPEVNRFVAGALDDGLRALDLDTLADVQRVLAASAD